MALIRDLFGLEVESDAGAERGAVAGSGAVAGDAVAEELADVRELRPGRR